MTAAGNNLPCESQKSRVHLGYLDGIRGLAALYVMLGHIFLQGDTRHGVSKMPAWFGNHLSWLGWGHFAVGVFIVLSGYCLMLPVAKDVTRSLPGGAWGFVKRRARRILPPYYAALALALGIIALVPGMRVGFSDAWLHQLPAFTSSAILSHLLLVHNLRPEWYTKIDGPLWSVGTEWQIYFLLPFLVLPLLRKTGVLPMALAMLVVGYLPHLIPGRPLDVAAPWYVGLFGMGSAAALLNYPTRPFEFRLRERLPWGWLAVVFATLLAGALALKPALAFSHPCLLDSMDGLMAACFIVYCTRSLGCRVDGGIAGFFVRLLQSRVPRTLGKFSYSLYLIHMPLIVVLDLGLTHFGLSPVVQSCLLFAIGVPFVLAASYLFYLVIEKPFVNSPLRRAAPPDPPVVRAAKEAIA